MRGRNDTGTRSRLGADERLSLSPWEEITGRMRRIDDDGGTVRVVLSTGTLVFPGHSSEAAILREQLEGEEGSFVSHLRTDLETKSLRVNVKRTT